MRYQLFRNLTPEEYEGLKKDIQENGQLVPIIRDEEGNILDGHHRYRICSELGITCKEEIEETHGLEMTRTKIVISANAHRRHLNDEEMRRIRVEMREGGMKYQEIADATGCSYGTAYADTHDVNIINSDNNPEEKRGRGRPVGAANKKRDRTELEDEQELDIPRVPPAPIFPYFECRVDKRNPISLAREILMFFPREDVKAIAEFLMEEWMNAEP